MSTGYRPTDPLADLPDIVLVPCRACAGRGKIKARVQYRGGRPCAEEMLECPFCGGTAQMTARQDAEFRAKYP